MQSQEALRSVSRLLGSMEKQYWVQIKPAQANSESQVQLTGSKVEEREDKADKKKPIRFDNFLDVIMLRQLKVFQAKVSTESGAK